MYVVYISHMNVVTFLNNLKIFLAEDSIESESNTQRDFQEKLLQFSWIKQLTATAKNSEKLQVRNSW